MAAQTIRGFDARGREIPDPTPVELSPGAIRPESSTSMIQRLVREQLSRQAVAEGDESFEEANDFDIDDDFEDPLTEYEVMGDESATAGESEEGAANAGDDGQAEPSRLRPGAARVASGSGNSETDTVDDGASDESASALPAETGKADLGSKSGAASVHGRGKRQSSRG